ncbi:MAG TPA: thrombospondin type 3 repeat-containing protein, partial [Candidatus Kryptonia bacterium]|nr:thrombospondin type 3 repeat-containing protein [Candidatus Kryptonia bacterium]
SDTNGNGISDGQDVINGTDPLPPRTATPTATTPPSPPTPTATTPPPPPTPTATATACPVGTRGSIIIFENLRVSATDDPLVTLANTANNQVHAQCAYANANQHCAGTGTICTGPGNCTAGDACAGGCAVTTFSIALNRLTSVAWYPSRGESGIPSVPEIPFSGELFCVQADSSGNAITGNQLAGSLVESGQCSIATTSLAGMIDAAPGRVLCLGGGVSDQCPNGPAYDSCPQGVDPARIESCWSQSQFTFVCGAVQ